MDELRRRMQEIRNSFDEKDFWLSTKLKKDFVDLAKVTLKRYGSNFKIFMDITWKDDNNLAYTTFNKICINAKHEQIQSCTTMEQKLLYVKGLLAHELSHILYMNKKSDEKYSKNISEGKWDPITASPSMKLEIADKMQYVQNRAMLVKLAHDLTNRTEDGYGERTFLKNSYGSLVQGLKYMRREFFKEINHMDDFQKTYEESPYGGISGVILLYSLYGRTADMKDGVPVWDDFKNCKPVIDKYLKTHSYDKRLLLIDEILVIYWDYIKKNMVDKDTGMTEEQAQQAAEQMVSEMISEQSESGKKPQRGQGSMVPVKVKEEKDEESGSGDGDEEESLEPKNGNGEEESTQQSEADARGEIAQMMQDIITEMAQEEMLEEQRVKQQQFADEINEDSRVSPHVRRIQEVTEEMVSEYDKYREDLKVSKRMQKLILQQVTDARKGGKQSGLYLGRRVEARTLIRNDGKYFYNNKLPKNTPRICIYVILDESGSMCYQSNGLSRMEYAVKTAVILEDFCRALDIPIEIIGHRADISLDNNSRSSSMGCVELDIFSSFEKVDKKDCYRITAARSTGNNRDGTALKYGYERLARRDEEIKILFIVSDGCPNALGYAGIPAIRDMRSIKEEYDRKGILTFAAAIGDDRETIETIYGDSFLDVSDMDSMPKIFTDKIVRFLKR